MDVHKDFGQIASEISSANLRNIDGEDAVTSTAFEAGKTSSSITSIEVDEADKFEDSETDLYRLDLSVTIAEMKGEEIEKELNNVLVEIEGIKSFPCEKCDKVCKAKGGLTSHVNSKHGKVPVEQLLI